MKDEYIISAEELAMVTGGTTKPTGYYACIFSRTFGTERHWYGPCANGELAISSALSGFTGTGFCEIHVYLKNADDSMTFVRKTYMCKQ